MLKVRVCELLEKLPRIGSMHKGKRVIKIKKIKSWNNVTVDYYAILLVGRSGNICHFFAYIPPKYKFYFGSIL